MLSGGPAGLALQPDARAGRTGGAAVLISNLEVCFMNTAELPQEIVSKLETLKRKLGTDDIGVALEKSLNIANFVADTVNDRESKLLVERGGKYTELKGIA